MNVQQTTGDVQQMHYVQILKEVLLVLVILVILELVLLAMVMNFENCNQKLT